MDKSSLRRLSLSSTSSSTLISSMKTLPGRRRQWQQEHEERKRWDWLDLSDSSRLSFSSDERSAGSSSSDAQEAGDEDSGWEGAEEDRYISAEQWSFHPAQQQQQQQQQQPDQEALSIDVLADTPSKNELITLATVHHHHHHTLSFPSVFNPASGAPDKLEKGHTGDDVLKFYQPKMRSTNIRANSFSTQITASQPKLTHPETAITHALLRPSVLHHHSHHVTRFSARNSTHNTRSTSGHLPPEANFVSSNIYLRPLPSTFTPLDLHELCMSMIRRTPDSRLLTLYNPDRNADDDDDDTHGDPSLSDNPANTTTHQEFRILSVKVMIEEEDQASLGSCKGFGFCLWNSVEASTRCIEGLRAHGYQASYARESSRGMLASLADPTSANIYLSNLPFHWGEEELRALFGDTSIASARLLRDRDDEAVGSGASRGVGFVRLACRSDALHFVEKLHGMPIPGTKCHLQCRMADSQAQKEWKRNVRSSLKQQLPLRPPGPAAPALPAPVEEWNRDATHGGAAAPHRLKWRSKKVGYKSHSTPPNYMVPPERRRASHTDGRHSQATKSAPGLDLAGGRGGHGFRVVSLGSASGGFLMPGFQMAPPVLPGGHVHGAYTEQQFQPLFPLLPVYPPAGWSPASPETSPTSSSVSPATPAKFPPTHVHWPAGEFFEKSTAYYYYHRQPEVYQSIPDHHLPQLQTHLLPPSRPPPPSHHPTLNDDLAATDHTRIVINSQDQQNPAPDDIKSVESNSNNIPLAGCQDLREPLVSNASPAGIFNPMIQL
ncbi:hypothetical protein PCANC_12189 [Puccinia coronata f. sp. avenae]|uniref:RRM domain-containing protein n=1 Tax=Puccinia coronata f. sp. avenae TaxID=200324 RepID=A0A2N5V9D2_9BASI|nr:hypothetical protein PCASD_07429 [Puccinia coronata f. sp. avenae]PLW48538.1 hypothetical protein PCANC_12189 [Puccinia coronata f. sp. avenae]